MLLILRSSAASSLFSRIVRIAQIFLGRHLIGARLAMADRGFANRLGRVPVPDDPELLPVCAIAAGPPIRASSASCDRLYREQLSHLASPVSEKRIYRPRSGTSIVAQLRRPWAAQSCAFRTSAMVPSNQIPAATSTTKKPSITAFSTLRLPSSSGGSGAAPRRPPSITASADRDERRRNSRRYDSAFPRTVHVLVQEFACDK